MPFSTHQVKVKFNFFSRFIALVEILAFIRILQPCFSKSKKDINLSFTQ